MDRGWRTITPFHDFAVMMRRGPGVAHAAQRARWLTTGHGDADTPLARAGFGGLIVLAFLLPFELTQHPFFHTDVLTLTNVKVVWYIVAALAAVYLLRAGKRAEPDALLPRALHRERLPLVLFAGLLLICLLSSAIAPARANGLKWTLDLLMGGVLWLVMPLWLAAGRDRKLRALARAIVLGATIAVTVGILELILGGSFADSLIWFKPKPTLAGSFLRLSGTFEYANIAAMYLDLALPFAVAGLLTALAPSRPRWRAVLAWALAVELLLEGLLLTYSRGALLGLAAAVVVVALIVHRHGRRRLFARRQRSALVVCAGLGAIIGAITLAVTPLALLRFTSQSDQEWYRATYRSQVPAYMVPCQRVTIPVTVFNQSPFTWQPEGAQVYNLGYHWLHAEGRVALFENPRTPLVAPVPPGGAQTLDAHIQAPPATGRYLLVWDMVQENVTWFSLKAASYTGHPVLVRGASHGASACAGRMPAPPGTRRGGPAQLPHTFSQPGRTQLWAAALRMLRARPLLGIGPDGFRLRYGAYMRPQLASWDTRILANQLELEIFADLGLLGGALFFGFLAAVWWPLATSLWMRGGAVPGVWQIAVLAAFAALLGHGLVDYLLDSHAIFLFLWLLCGLASTLRADI
jgi:hypothetical protein